MLQPSRSRLCRTFSVDYVLETPPRTPELERRAGRMIAWGGIEDSKFFRGYYAPCYTESFSRNNNARGR